MRADSVVMLLAIAGGSPACTLPAQGDSADAAVARKLAAVPVELYLADSNLHIVNLYKLEATVLRETRGRTQPEGLDRLVRDVYAPYAAFWKGYAGDEAHFRSWAATALLDTGHVAAARLAAVLDVPFDRLYTETAAWIVRATGRRPHGTWYLLFGPGWTDMGGLTDGSMLMDFAKMEPDRDAIAILLPHELTHMVHGTSPAVRNDPDTGTVLAHIVSEGLATYADYVYWGSRRTPAQAVGYSDGEWAWSMAHESELIAAAKPLLGSRA